jgi:hypothetical protein
VRVAFVPCLSLSLTVREGGEGAGSSHITSSAHIYLRKIVDFVFGASPRLASIELTTESAAKGRVNDLCHSMAIDDRPEKGEIKRIERESGREKRLRGRERVREDKRE